MKKYLIIIVAIIVVSGVYIWMRHRVSNTNTNVVENSTTNDYKNASYTVENETIQLMNGSHEEPAASGSAETVTTQYFGNEVTGDFNNDGSQDVAFILTQSGGGTGVFYYVVAALKTANGYQGTNAVFLGDRIAPQTTEFKNGEIIVNYTDRKPGEPFSISPSVGVSKYLKISGDKLIEVGS